MRTSGFGWIAALFAAAALGGCGDIKVSPSTETDCETVVCPDGRSVDPAGAALCKDVVPGMPAVASDGRAGTCVGERSCARLCVADEACPGGGTCTCDTDADCDSGDMCQPRACVVRADGGRSCQDGPPVVCPESPAGDCLVSECDPATGQCAPVDAELDTPCDDDELCTQDDRCSAGVCAGTPYTCDDGLACTADECNGDGTCSNVAGSSCSDGSACTDDSCDPVLGCVFEPNGLCDCGPDQPCPVPDACQPSACVEGGDGLWTCELGEPVQCDDGLACTSDLCTAGACVSVPDDACVIEETCVAAGTPNPANPCEICDPIAATDSWSPAPDGQACTDDDACTVADTCASGVCEQGDDAECSDGSACTDDSCDPVEGCVSVPNGECECGPDQPCAVTDACHPAECVEGVDGVRRCEPGEPVYCPESSQPCHSTACDPATGACVNMVEVGLSCDDGNECTGLDSCQPDGGCAGVAVADATVCGAPAGCGPEGFDHGSSCKIGVCVSDGVDPVVEGDGVCDPLCEYPELGADCWLDGDYWELQLGELVVGNNTSAPGEGFEPTKAISRYSCEPTWDYPGKEVVYRFTPQVDGQVTIKTGAGTSQSVDAIVLGTGGGGGCRPDLCLGSHYGAGATTVEVEANETYCVVMDYYLEDKAGDYEVQVVQEPVTPTNCPGDRFYADFDHAPWPQGWTVQNDAGGSWTYTDDAAPNTNVGTFYEGWAMWSATANMLTGVTDTLVSPRFSTEGCNGELQVEFNYWYSALIYDDRPVKLLLDWRSGNGSWSTYAIPLFPNVGNPGFTSTYKVAVPGAANQEDVQLRWQISCADCFSGATVGVDRVRASVVP